jgi:hypothetical protein
MRIRSGLEQTIASAGQPVGDFSVGPYTAATLYGCVARAARGRRLARAAAECPPVCTSFGVMSGRCSAAGSVRTTPSRCTAEGPRRDARRVALATRVSLDSVSTGLTSFSLLEPEFVKLDVSLVRGVHQNPINSIQIRLSVIGSEAVLSVQDGGIGMSAAVRSQLFKPCRAWSRSTTGSSPSSPSPNGGARFTCTCRCARRSPTDAA